MNIVKSDYLALGIGKMKKIRIAALNKLNITRNQQGFTLIEAVLGIALLSIVAVAVLVGISTSFRVNGLADEQSTGMSVAINQIEYLNTQVYKIAPLGGEVTYTKIASIPTNFTIWSYDRSGTLVSDIVGVPWSSSIDGTDGAIADDSVEAATMQKITLVIKQGNNETFTIETYKVK